MNKKNINDSFCSFFGKIESLLNDMAPIRKLNKKEIRLKQRPWITKGILISMHKRVKLLKLASKTSVLAEKQIFV